jgi:hypothetical protein
MGMGSPISGAFQMSVGGTGMPAYRKSETHPNLLDKVIKNTKDSV